MKSMIEEVSAPADPLRKRVMPISGLTLEGSLSVVLVTALICWLVLSWRLTAQTVVHDYIALPVMDYWREVQYYEQYRAFDFSFLLKQHNEHRIFFPELVFITDMLLFHGRQMLPLVLSFTCYVANWIVLSWAFVSGARKGALPKAVAILLAGIIISSEASSQVLNFAFLLNWTFVQLASLLAFSFVFRLTDTSRLSYLTAAIIAGVVATYSSGNGMLLWPILVAAALAAGVQRRQVVVLALAGAGSIGLFFVGYHSSNAINLLQILRHPSYSVGFIGSYLGMPFGYGKPVVGLLNFGCFGVLAFLAIRHRLWRSQPFVVYFGSYLFTLATIAITMTGRMDTNDPAFTAAMVPRYVTIPLVNWAILLLTALWLSSRLNWRVPSWAHISLFTALFLLLALPKVHRWVETSERTVMGEQAGALSLEDGLIDPELTKKVFPAPEFVAAFLPVLRAHHLSVFSQPQLGWIGKDAKDLFQIQTSGSATGGISQVKPLISGVEVIGWTDSLSRATRVVFLSDTNQVVGLGRRLQAGFPPEMGAEDTPSLLAWVGFIDSKFFSSSYRAFVVNGQSARPLIVQIGRQFKVPDSVPAAAAMLGAPIVPIRWPTRTGWVENQIPSGVNAGDSHSAAFLSSWSGGDESTGKAISTNFPVTGGCFILPVLHGPMVDHLSVRLLNDKDEQVAAIPLAASQSQWQLFQTRTSATQVRIVAEDSGQGWGEWAAIGQPYNCK